MRHSLYMYNYMYIIRGYAKSRNMQTGPMQDVVRGYQQIHKSGGNVDC